MEYDILITKQPNNGYLARPVLMPEIVVAGHDEAEALDKVRQAISAAYSQSYIARITVPMPELTETDPWFRFAGEWGDEKRTQQFQKDIDALRRFIDEHAQDE